MRLLHSAERIPAAKEHAIADADEVVQELPGLDKAVIELKAAERSLLICAEHRSPGQSGRLGPEAEGYCDVGEDSDPAAKI